MTRPLTEKNLRELSAHLASGDGPEKLKLSPPPKKRKRDNRESRLQKSVIRWWASACREYGLEPELLYAVPNGAVYGSGDERMIRARILIDEGLRAGWPDVGLDVARHGFHGLRIEMKLPDTKPDTNQLRIHSILRSQGYKVEVCRSLEEAKAVIGGYLKIPTISTR